jgi:hypothetical protein
VAPGLSLRLPGVRPLFVESSGAIWIARGRRILRRDYESSAETPFGEWPLTFRERIGMVSRLAARALRSGLKGLLKLPDDSVLVLAKGRFLKAGRDGSFREVLRVRRGSGPLGVCVTPTGALYFGEYFFNDARAEVHVFGSHDCGDSWAIVHTFPPGAIRHVHNIVYDSFRKGCWITTGDSDAESMILFTGNDFRSLERVFYGEQRFRTVSLIPTAEALIAATDTPLEQNYIMRLLPETARAEPVQAVSGSVFAMCRAGRFAVASVAVEPSKVNLSRNAQLLLSADGVRWKELYSRPKDRWQLPYNRVLPDKISELPFFQHGAFELPWGTTQAPILYAYGQALLDDDNCLLGWDLEQTAPALFESQVAA